MPRIDTQILSTQDLPGHAPVLSTALLSRIHQLNLDYVELLIAQRASPSCATQLQHLPVAVHELLAQLSPASRLLLASLPFTLYSLGFEDETFWRRVCETAPNATLVPIEQRYAPPDSISPQASFCDVALLHAWYVAASNRLAARVIYAMPDITALRLAQTPPWRIKRIAAEHPALLAPRWPTNPGFWPDLLHFATTNDTSRFATARLLGNQLIASELEAIAARRRGRAADHWIGSPRLRARKLVAR